MSQADDEKYLIFKVGDEHLAAPLFAINEIIERLPIRYVPNPSESFLGLSNLRGQLVGVFDVGLKFGLPSVADRASGVLLIIEIDGMLLAGLVDSVLEITDIPEHQIMRDCDVNSSVPEDALIGVANLSQRILQIIDIPGVLKSA